MWYRYFSKFFIPLVTSVFVQVFMLIDSMAQAYPLVWHAPTENPHFMGRKDVLDEIASLFKSANVKTAVVTGSQGFGKTQIAKKYVHQNFDNYDVVWWFHANQYMKPQFERFAQEMVYHFGADFQKSIENLGPEQLVRKIKEQIRQRNLRCLIVFDDAHKYSDIEPFILFSHGQNIHTLVTSKNEKFSATAIKLKPFPRENSVAYVTRFLPEEPAEEKNNLAATFSDCPLALAQSIDYIKNHPGMKIEHYLHGHKQNKASLLWELSHRGPSKKLGSLVDEYNTDFITATNMNMSDIKSHSKDAYDLLGIVSLLHKDEIPLQWLLNWMKKRGIQTNLMTLIDAVNQYSFIDITPTSTKKEAYATMHELSQSMVAALLPAEEKKVLIAEAAELLKDSFSGRSDQNVETILKDNTPLLNVAHLSQEAHLIDFHNPDLTLLRIRVLDVLVGMIRDFATADKIMAHLLKDIEQKVEISKEDEVLNYANMALNAAINSPDYDKAIGFGLKALNLVEAHGNMPEEHLRILSNLIQNHALTGQIDGCDKYIKVGEGIFEDCKADAHKALFILAKNVFLLENGDLDGVIAASHAHKKLWMYLESYPSMRYFILLQLGDAFIKKGDVEEAKMALKISEEFARDYHGANENNMFFGRLHVLKGMCLFADPKALPKVFEEAKSSIGKGIKILETSFSGPNKHKSQGFAHMQLGRLYHLNKHYEEAKEQYLKSEAIFDKVLKGKRIDDVSQLYKQMALLGFETHDEKLTHKYLEKLMTVFGVNHYATQNVVLFLDEHRVPLPF